MESITSLLDKARSGDRTAFDEVMTLLYGELRRIASGTMRSERPGHTLQPTALVNEAYIRLTSQRQLDFASRAHFLAIAAHVMRNVLVDYARTRRRDKRGGGQAASPLDDAIVLASTRGLDLIALHDALLDLARIDERQAKVVEQRVFAGMTVEETAEALGVSPVTVKRDFSVAKAWLLGQIQN